MSMTSTEFTIGLAGDGARNSSRVLRPPGGGHTDIFGAPEPEPARGRRQGYAAGQQASSIGQGDEPQKPKNGIEPAQKQNGSTTPEQPSAPDSTPEPAEPQMAPEARVERPVEAPPKAESQPAAAEPQKRVRVPPGGFSSGLW